MKNYKLAGKLLIIINIFLIVAAAGVFLHFRGQPQEEIPSPSPVISPLCTESPSASPETVKKATIKDFLKTAVMPVGSTMYVYGGGWNEEDTGAGEYAVTIGVPQEWKDFSSMQNSSYDSTEHRYKIKKGLDCSGYVGWVIYNTLESENGKPGYVFFAQEFAEKLAEMGFGEKTDKKSVKSYMPGDILSSDTDAHVWIAVGECEDGSVVLLNSSPPGVRICGTAAPNGKANSQALSLAEKYMREMFPEWYGKYSNCYKNTSYLTNYDRFRWYLDGEGVMADPDGYYSLTPEEILEDIFNKE